jgi:putative transcriptional regulator
LAHVVGNQVSQSYNDSTYFDRRRSVMAAWAGFCEGAQTPREPADPGAPVNVAAVRTSVGLSQQQFAARYSFSLDEIQAWESGQAEPNGIATAYLRMIAGMQSA